ncbi:hypothetical protein B0H10DRAFT_2249219 [Mycena sp. CBHHK59/15]|nr:hypothetical protein B0H10DRAFT_2249219 [Mycena sp. CBHHK59/15]
MHAYTNSNAADQLFSLRPPIGEFGVKASSKYAALTLGARSVGAGRRSRPDTWTNFKALRASTPGPAVADPVPTCVLLLLLRDFVNLTVCVSKPDGAGLDIGPPLIDSLAPQKHGWLFGRTSWVRLDWHGPSAAEAWGRRRRSAPSLPRPRTPPAGNGGQLQLSISRSAQLVDPAARAVLKAAQTRTTTTCSTRTSPSRASAL